MHDHSTWRTKYLNCILDQYLFCIWRWYNLKLRWVGCLGHNTVWDIKGPRPLSIGVVRCCCQSEGKTINWSNKLIYYCPLGNRIQFWNTLISFLFIFRVFLLYFRNRKWLGIKVYLFDIVEVKVTLRRCIYFTNYTSYSWLLGDSKSLSNIHLIQYQNTNIVTLLVLKWHASDFYKMC